MNIIINQVELEKQDLTAREMLFLLSLYYGIPNIDKLYRKGYYTETSVGKMLSVYGKEVVENILLNSDSEIPKEENLIDLATRLKQIFPTGRKEGTNLYWSDGIPLIIKRLRTFFKKYGKYDYDDIVSAAQKYVESFNGDYRYMKLLKYFIFKDVKGEGGSIEESSDLINFLENKDSEINNTDIYTEIR